MLKCELCNLVFKSNKSLCLHLKQKHSLSKIEIQEYYDKYIKSENNGLCYLCGKQAKFINFTKGYHKICNSDICLSKTRSTNSYEFYMYKYKVNKDEAILLYNDYKSKMKVTLKKTLELKILENENYFKENSHQTKEFWIKRGYDEMTAINKAKNVMNDIHNKAANKRKNHPELYTDIYQTQIGYWLKKGLSEQEAKSKLKERQITFSLNICINKHGEEKGKLVWQKRQQKWCKNNKKSNFSKISQKLFWLIYNNLKDKNNIYFATLKNGELDDSGRNNEYRLQLKTRIILPDFIINKKIIEFDGDYYHNINGRAELDHIRDLEILDCGYEILHIKECDFNNDNEKTLHFCLDFINKKI